MEKLFGGIYNGKKVFITGHTGFKGSWLIKWLERMGAECMGYALAPDTEPNHFSFLEKNFNTVTADIRDKSQIKEVICNFRPDIVFHLAAQPLVRRSYREPAETFETNVMGTINVFEACRCCDSIKAIVNVTSDKCYDNKEWVWGYRENDPMGGYDPYSASKGCAELVTGAWRNSFFNLNDYGREHSVLLASCRAGNVIGGGDWSEDRLIPDAVRSIASSTAVDIRNPYATRPWQHVLEPLSGYLAIGQKLLEGKKEYADGWNLGPSSDGHLSVGDVLVIFKQYWPRLEYVFGGNKDQLHEAKLLKLDTSKALALLGLKSVWDAGASIKKTAIWYKNFYELNIVSTDSDIDAFIADARHAGLDWSLG